MSELKKTTSIESDSTSLIKLPWAQQLKNWGVEARGIHPVSAEHRTDDQYRKIFFVWFSMNFNILSFSAGTLGPVIFGLGVRDSCLVILFFNLLCTLPPAYLCTWGPKLGMRQMVASRFSFGYYGVIIPCIFNLLGMFGFCILNTILGGQSLASVADGKMSWSVGIVVICLVSLGISFCGYKVLNYYEQIAWVPVLITYVIALAVGGKHLFDVPTPAPATAVQILGFASTIAGFVVTYSPLSSDFTQYMRPDVPSKRIFIYAYLGFLLPITAIQCLGAAVAATAPFIPAWDTGFAGGHDVGGLLAAMLRPVGNGFSKFLMVLLSLSVMGNIAATFYTIGLNFQIFLPVLLRVPRYIFSIVASAIVIPIAIVGAHRFYDAIVNFLGLIGYWASVYVAVVLLEHFVFRHGSFLEYDISQWNQPSGLPTGVPALLTLVISFAAVVPFMHQVWWVGPAARTTGDIGFEVAFVVALIAYLVLRSVEIKWKGQKAN